MTKVFKTFILLYLAFLFPGLATQAQSSSGLNEDNILSYYQYFESSNTKLKEGREDLDVWLSFLDRNLADDYRRETIFYDVCSNVPETRPQIDKERLLKIYKKIGINNYKRFQVDVASIKFADDAASAEVRYSVDLETNEEDMSFTIHVDCKAIHVWNAEKQRPEIRAQYCDERILEENGRGGCSLWQPHPQDGTEYD